jgi:hypothetical protein
LNQKSKIKTFETAQCLCERTIDVLH